MGKSSNKSKEQLESPTCSPPGIRIVRLRISYLPTDWLCYCHLADDP